MEALESVIEPREADNDSFDWMEQFRSDVKHQLESSYMINDSGDPDDQARHQTTIDHLTTDAMNVFFNHEREVADLLLNDPAQIRAALKSPIYQQQLCLADTPLHVVRAYLARPRMEGEIPGPYYCRSRRLLQRHIHDAFMSHFNP